MYLWFLLVCLLVAGPIIDSFAGERERHSLEPLFATRLPDSAILSGKIVAVAFYGWLVTLCATLVSIAILYLVDTEQFSLAITPILLSALLLAPTASLLASTASALISMTASSVRQAQQTVVAAIAALTVVGLAALVLLEGNVVGNVPDTYAAKLIAHPQASLWAATALCMLCLTMGLFAIAYRVLRRCRSLPA
jgi:ABC-2 type transport system permease protein